MQKGCQKGSSPQPPADPLEGSLLRREHAEKQQTNKKTTMIAESWRCSARKVSRARKRSQHASGACGPERIFGNQGPREPPFSRAQANRKRAKGKQETRNKPKKGSNTPIGRWPGEFKPRLFNIGTLPSSARERRGDGTSSHCRAYPAADSKR